MINEFICSSFICSSSSKNNVVPDAGSITQVFTGRDDEGIGRGLIPYTIFSHVSRV
jgi:hypothetical protein